MKKSIVIVLLLVLFSLGNAMSNERKTILKQKKLNFHKSALNMERDKYLPKKLLISTLPDDYPKELDELFKFYYDVIYKIASYNHELTSHYRDFYYNTKTEELLNSLPEKKISRIRYLIWLAWNSIPEYYAEYIKINGGKRIGDFSFEEVRKKSILPDKFWKGYFFDNHLAIYPKVGVINAKIFNMIREKYAEKLKIINPMYETRDKIYIKGKILKKKLVYVNYEGKDKKIPFYLLKVGVLDAIGNQFKKKEIILFVGIFDSINWLDNIIKIEIGNEYFFPISVTAKRPYIKDTLYFDGKKVNRAITYFVPINGFSMLENDELIGYIPRQFWMFKKEGEKVKYQDIKKEIESEINFLKSLSENEEEK